MRSSIVIAAASAMGLAGPAIAQDSYVLGVTAALTGPPASTYAPAVTEAKNAGVPLLFASSVCPKEVYPPANEGQFCTTAFASTYDSRAALAFVNETAK